MLENPVFRTISVAAAIAATALGAIADLAASLPLKDGDQINGFIRSNSPGFQYRTNSGASAPVQRARGEEHTFAAKRGDTIEVTVEPEDGSTLRPVLVLLDPMGRQVAYSENPTGFRYQVIREGTYRLLVLGRNNSLGRYSLSFDGLTSTGTPVTTVPTAPVAQADQVMQDVLRLRIIGCGVPNVARIKIGTEERCTRDIEPGVYAYDTTTKSIKLVDARRELLAEKLQLTILDRCPSPATSVAQITLTDPQDGRDYTYCANPNRYVQAGTYRYNPATDRLTAANVVQPTPTTPIPVDPLAESRRKLLQDDYGLRVLDNCPPARSAYVVVNFAEEGQLYQYCANPNRLFAAGEYNYNAKTGSLDKATKPANCTISVGGICLLK